MTKLKKQLGAEAVLILVTFFWGTTFVVVAGAIKSVPVFWFTFLRFSLSAAILWVFVFAARDSRRRLQVAARDLKIWRAGAVIGFFLFLGYAFQTLGLVTTSSTKSAFITSTLVLWTPVLAFVFLRRRPRAEIMAAIPPGLAGLLLLVVNPSAETFSLKNLVIGDFFTLLCAWFFSAHILAIKHWTEHYPTGMLAALQLSVVAVLALFASPVVGEERRWTYDGRVMLAIGFLAVFATAFAFWAQTKMQRFTSEERTGIIFLFEPVFGALTAYAVADERLTGVQWIGVVLIFLSAAIPGVYAVVSESRIGGAGPAS